jgi:large subunit ribosomal protein L17
MRHRRAGRKLNRNATHRLALYRNLAMALFRHESIITTVEKAKAVRPFVEKLITLARKATLEPDKALHARRLVLSRLGTPSNAEVNPSDDEAVADHRKVIVKLFTDIGPRFKDRPGGYTRIIKRHERRLGDGGKTAFLELLKEGETKFRANPPEAPAPKVEDETPEETEQMAEGQEDAQAGQTPEGQTEAAASQSEEQPQPGETSPPVGGKASGPKA